MKRRALSQTERTDWLCLSRTQNVGPVAFRDLLRRYGTAREALDALPDLVSTRKLRTPNRSDIERELDAAREAGVRYLAACEPEFPEALFHIDPPPPMISVIGDVARLSTPSVAIVGSRNASALGRKFAAHLAQGLGEAGQTIVSGLALGIDAAAHQAALPTGTVAVLGGGPDHIYPRQNTELYHSITEQGAIVSESPLGYRAQARDFPRRNRIISGLSQGVVVVEAAERSGTLITARYALEQGRDVMACPGSPLDPRTKGCNRLIRQGATLVETVEDVLDALANRPHQLLEPDDSYGQVEFDWKAAASDIAAAKEQLMALSSPTPTPRDDLIRESGCPTPIANAALLELELEGRLAVEPDGRIARASL